MFAWQIRQTLEPTVMTFDGVEGGTSGTLLDVKLVEFRMLISDFLGLSSMNCSVGGKLLTEPSVLLALELSDDIS